MLYTVFIWVKDQGLVSVNEVDIYPQRGGQFCFIYWSILRGNLLNLKKKISYTWRFIDCTCSDCYAFRSRTFYSYRNRTNVGEGLKKNSGLCSVAMTIEHRDFYLARSDGTTFLYPGISITTLLFIIEKTWNLNMLMFL